MPSGAGPVPGEWQECRCHVCTRLLCVCVAARLSHHPAVQRLLHAAHLLPVSLRSSISAELRVCGLFSQASGAERLKEEGGTRL